MTGESKTNGGPTQAIVDATPAPEARQFRRRMNDSLQPGFHCTSGLGPSQVRDTVVYGVDLDEALGHEGL